MVIEEALSSCENSGIDIPSDSNLSDLEYANDIVLSSKDPSKLQFFSRSSER